MKKILFLLTFVMLGSITVSAQDTLVTFKFKVKKDSSHTYGSAFNAVNIMLRDASYTDTLRYFGGVDGNPPVDFSLASVNWDNGMGTKYYYTSFSSSAHTNITFSSRQKSSGTGPRDFNVQYKLGAAGTWTDIVGSTVVCANDAFLSGTLTNIALPSECNNYPEVYLRWVMTSNMSVGGVNPVAATGTSRIDNVFILGDLITGIDDNSFRNSISIYPNPSNGIFTISNIPDQTLSVEVFDMLGNSVYKTQSSAKDIKVDMGNTTKGIYFVELTNPNGSKLTKKMVVR